MLAGASDKAVKRRWRRRLKLKARLMRLKNRLFARTERPPVEEYRPIASVRIDDLAGRLQGRVDIIKIDVEGAEPLVLAGARETIRGNRNLAIVMEWSPGQIEAAGFDLRRFTQEIADLSSVASRSNRICSGPSAMRRWRTCPISRASSCGGSKPADRMGAGVAAPGSRP
jgi:hypothetical protein